MSGDLNGLLSVDEVVEGDVRRRLSGGWDAMVSFSSKRCSTREGLRRSIGEVRWDLIDRDRISSSVGLVMVRSPFEDAGRGQRVTLDCPLLHLAIDIQTIFFEQCLFTKYRSLEEALF